MPPQFALAASLGFTCWLFVRDRKHGNSSSGATWIPLIWLLILGSRPVSSWIGFDQTSEPVYYQDGSPLDRNVFLGLMLAGFFVLWRRQIRWRKLISSNPWLIVYFAYLGLSVIWADYPSVAFKRWCKDCGNIIMVLILLTESDPARAIQQTLARCGYALVPLSVVLIKYFPETGRYYNQFIWTYSYGGVATDKNTLGMTLLVCGLGIFWKILDFWNERVKNRRDLLAHFLLIGMCAWLWSVSKCATSLACSLLAIGMLFALKMTSHKKELRQAWLLGLSVLAFIILISSLIFGPLSIATSLFGRDTTLTGRTEIWQELLKLDINRWFGTGYGSLWQPDCSERLSKALGFYVPLKEAHNGYLEIYLNCGLIGLGLFIAVLLGSVRKTVKSLSAGNSYNAFRFVVLTVAIIYNVTESAFCGLVMMWIILLLAITDISRLPSMARNRKLSKPLKAKVQNSAINGPLPATGSF